MKTEKRKNSGQSGSSYSERKITQIKELKTLLWGLDLDEGIRFVVDIAGFEHGAFLFVTKLDDKFCVAIKERVLDKTANDYVPGAKERWKYFEKAEAAWQFISRYIKPPFEAYYY